MLAAGKFLLDSLLTLNQFIFPEFPGCRILLPIFDFFTPIQILFPALSQLNPSQGKLLHESHEISSELPFPGDKTGKKIPKKRDFPFSLPSQNFGEKPRKNPHIPVAFPENPAAVFWDKIPNSDDFFLPTEQPTTTLLLRIVFPTRFPGNSYPKLHSPSLFFPNIIQLFWNHSSFFPHGKAFFGGTQGLEQPPKNPPGDSQRIWDFLGMADLLLLQEEEISFLGFILEFQIQEILREFGEFRCLQFCLWMCGSAMDPLGIPGFFGIQDGIYSFPKDFANTSCALG